MRSPTTRSAIGLVRPSAISTGVSPARQYVQPCEQPRYGFTVQPNGMDDAPGTLFSTDLAITSWNTRPLNSGVRTLRTNPLIPGSALCACSSTRCPSHLTYRFEHMFEHPSNEIAQSIPSDHGQRGDPPLPAVRPRRRLRRLPAHRRRGPGRDGDLPGP